MTASSDLLQNHISGELLFTVYYTPEMLCDLMDYYLLSKEDMALCMGVTTDCLHVLLSLKENLPKLFNTRIGYATIILILGTRKYGVRRFLKWYRYYLSKYKITAPIENYIYSELIKLLYSTSQISISYYWDELKPTRVIELPSYFNK
jgi:hypothetical protein